jgi:hypothetical protein
MHCSILEQKYSASFDIAPPGYGPFGPAPNH